MKRLFKYFNGYKLTSVLSPLLKLVEAVLELFIPILVSKIIDKGILEGDLSYCVKMILLMVLLGILGFAASLLAQYFAARSATGFATKVRSATFAHLQTLSFKDMDKLGVSTMISRMTNDINQIQNGVNMALRLLLRSPFIVFGAMIMAFTQDVKGALVFVVVIPILFVIVSLIMAYTIPRFKQVQLKLDKVLGLTRENVNGVRVIRAFRNEDREQAKFNETSNELKGMQEKVGRISGLMNPLTYVVINSAIIFLIYTCSERVKAGLIGVGTTVALYNYMSQILVELIKLANLIITITKALACANRVADIMDIKPCQADGTEDVEDYDRSLPIVEFDEVTSNYHKDMDPAIHDISFKAYAGETIGVIGGTGSGKSTLVHLIPRFYDVTAGEVKVFGKDVKKVQMDKLRKRIAVVMQKAVLLSGDIRSNLLFSNEEADDKTLRTALEASQSAGFLSVDASEESLKSALDYTINQGGNNLSGGQRQRVSIARALARQPEILILDDSASALDYATDAALRKAINSLEPKPTTFIVSQRTSSVAHADKIIVLDDGKMVGLGSHEDLLKTCDVYREIHLSQTSSEKEVG